MFLELCLDCFFPSLFQHIKHRDNKCFNPFLSTFSFTSQFLTFKSVVSFLRQVTHVKGLFWVNEQGKCTKDSLWLIYKSFVSFHLRRKFSSTSFINLLNINFTKLFSYKEVLKITNSTYVNETNRQMKL